MKIEIDTEKHSLVITGPLEEKILPLYCKESFDLLSELWVNVGWDQKYSYTFSWFGIPVIQLPEDIVRVQEVIYRLKPDVIVETGVAHGGSLVLYASIFEAMGHGKVIGVDIEIRPHNRAAIEKHPLFNRIDLIEGNSVSTETVEAVRSRIPASSKVMVILDSNHTYEHVSRELKAYYPLVTKGSYIVSTDGIMRDVCESPRGDAAWVTNNPANAAEDFVKSHPEFQIEQPDWVFNESKLDTNITHWPSAWLRRLK